MASESLQCLQALSSSKIGILHLLRHRTPESLAKVITTQVPGLLFLVSAVIPCILTSCYHLYHNDDVAVKPEAAKDLLLYVLGDTGAQGATNYHTTASNVLSLLAKEFNATQVSLHKSMCNKNNKIYVFQDELKFTLCDILYSVLSLSGESLVSILHYFMP